MKRLTAIQVADHMLFLAYAQGQSLCREKLCGLVFLAHGWHLVLFDKPLFSDPVEYGPNGPVIAALDRKLARYKKAQPIHAQAMLSASHCLSPTDRYSASPITGGCADMLDILVRHYKNTHAEVITGLIAVQIGHIPHPRHLHDKGSADIKPLYPRLALSDREIAASLREKITHLAKHLTPHHA